ncbi:MAG: isoprenylcysteine carboxylmethyltransferase family protein, partial [Acetatifactor sp.]|nr:isoprenylcysteine carboxylmethyltransferase family protein [Acetatifactor sp.]
MRDSWRAGIAENDKTEIITNGIYSISRNPAFLAFDCVYIGLLLMFFHWVLLIFTIFAITMLHLQILQEEAFLTKAFGGEYINYQSKVCRYLGRKR